MLSLGGRFTFTAARPQLHCAAFLISEPHELLTVAFDLVSIDCRGGDFLKVRRRPATGAGGRCGTQNWRLRGCPWGGALRGPHATGPPLDLGTSPRTREGLCLARGSDLESPLCAPGADASRDLTWARGKRRR